MKRSSIPVVALLLAFAANAGDNALLVGVQRHGDTYQLSARFDTTLSQCAAYLYLTDYEAATALPGILASTASRESANTVRVERTAEERVLFMRVLLHSVMEFTEYPDNKLTFIQRSGDSKAFHGSWRIEPNPGGSSLYFEGEWQPDTLLPFFVIDYFAKHDLEKRFGEIARLAETQKPLLVEKCLQPGQLARR
ncbi:MAG: hypothetical protein PHH36_12725 [Sideroxydans sp.]|nr:hypothetical protein [Sideroxydans sp.]